LAQHERDAERLLFGGDEDDPPWVRVEAEDVPGLMTAYRVACQEAERTRAGLMAQTGSGPVPEVIASVEADGGPVVIVDRSRVAARDDGGGSGAVA
jgi:hypothetical protein